MNRLTGKIIKIQKSGSILLVDVDVDGHSFSALLIESAAFPEWLREGHIVDLLFKETEVSLACNLMGKISMRNRMDCKILKIDKGELLSRIELQFETSIINSAITTRSVDMLELEIGSQVEALVKANEIMLTKKL
jgi:molybdate transport system regulatory protein